jgi:hypothetical protein
MILRLRDSEVEVREYIRQNLLILDIDRFKYREVEKEIGTRNSLGERRGRFLRWT